MLESQVSRKSVRIGQREIVVGVKFEPTNRRHPAQAEIYPYPAVVDLSDRSVRERFDLKLQQPAKMLCASKVTRHPVQVKGTTGEHAKSANVLSSKCRRMPVRRVRLLGAAAQYLSKQFCLAPTRLPAAIWPA